MGKESTKNMDNYYVEGIASSDRLVVNKLYKEYLPRIQKMVFANNGTEDDGLDVFQETLLVLFNKFRQPDFTLSCSFYTFLYAVSRNIWFNRLKKIKNARVTSLDMDVSNEEEGVLESLEQYDRFQLYREKFRLLGASCRQILQLFFEGKSMREIAGLLSITEKYARKRKFNCKEKLVKLVQADPKFKELANE